MSDSRNEHMQERARQLGIPYGTARNMLNKRIMFSMVQRLGLDTCHRCGQPIEDVDDLSVEHKKAWLYEPNARELFFDLDNIAFSHHKCNSGASRNKLGSSGYRGVESYGTYQSGRPRFRARLGSITLATSEDPQYLAQIYDQKVIEERGPNAITNASLGLL